jgi:hypothetical protein
MFANPAASWYNSNYPKAHTICEHCGGIVRHQKWCITCDPFVQYAYGVVLEPAKLTLRDRLILHALGVAWVQNPFEIPVPTPLKG